MIKRERQRYYADDDAGAEMMIRQRLLIFLRALFSPSLRYAIIDVDAAITPPMC